jgi:Hemerythrin HHE cation binding domain
MDAPAGPAERLTAFGNELIEIHVWLREELARLRADVGSYLDGRGERPRDLKVHCLSFCSALTRHHAGEDVGAFPLLAKASPELRPVIAQLEDDHHNRKPAGRLGNALARATGAGSAGPVSNDA